MLTKIQMPATSGKYRAHVSGFTHYCNTVTDLQNWLDDLKSRHRIAGETITIHKCDGGLITVAKTGIVS